jgi:hypothetical protein
MFLKIHVDEISYHPVTLPLLPMQEKSGVGMILYNCDGNLMLTKNENQPNVIYIRDLKQLKLIAIVQQLDTIKSIKWNPVNPDQLCFCCSTGLIYIWERDIGCDAIEVPAVNFCVADFIFRPDGRSLILHDKSNYCLAYFVDEYEE